jgi:5-methylcytosine-specific restriction enzyme subunit McrC
LREVIVAKDLSPIDLKDDNERLWLQHLAQTTETSSLMISLKGISPDPKEPLVTFQNGRWWTGRFVGEVSFQGRTLLILPRYETGFHRWISRIFGIQLIPQTGHYQKSFLWLWELIARIWSEQLVLAAKHGLPYVRTEEKHCGRALRGRLDVRQTAAEWIKGTQMLVSNSRNKRIHSEIGSIILKAYSHLQKELGQKDRRWLSNRGAELIRQLQAEIPPSFVRIPSTSQWRIRYNPIHESYRSIVSLSLSILKQMPISSTFEGERKVYGVLLDMAEVWELYVLQLLKNGLTKVHVIHTGRQPEASGVLYINGIGQRLGHVKPDILIKDPRTHQVLMVLDAKYKNTGVSMDRPQGVEREDLYQINSYLDVWSHPDKETHGALVYPFDETGEIKRLSENSPWKGRSRKTLWFFGLSASESEFSQSESDFLQQIQTILQDKNTLSTH